MITDFCMNFDVACAHISLLGWTPVEYPYRNYGVILDGDVFLWNTALTKVVRYDGSILNLRTVDWDTVGKNILHNIGCKVDWETGHFRKGIPMDYLP